MQWLAFVRQNLLARPGRAFLTGTAIALGVAMVVAVSTVSVAALEAGRAVNEVGRASHEIEVLPVRGDFLAAAQGLAFDVPGVAAVGGVLGVPAGFGDEQVTLLGVQAEPYALMHGPGLTAGRWLAESDGQVVVVPALWAALHRLEPGDKVSLGVGRDTSPWTVVGLLETTPDLETVFGDWAWFAPLDAVQRAAGLEGRLTRLEVRLEAGATVETVRSALQAGAGDGAAVMTVTTAGQGDFGDYFLVGILFISGMVVLAAAAFLVFNAFAMTVTERQREIGLWRCLGMTRRQVLRLILLEALALGGLGMLAGLAIGPLAARGVMAVVGALQPHYAADDIHTPWWAVTLAVLLGLGMTLLSALPPAWGASRLSPLAVLQARVREGRGWYWERGPRLGGAVMVAVGVALVYRVLNPAPVDYVPGQLLTMAVMVWYMAAVVLLLPALIGLTARLLRALLRRIFGLTGRLVADNLGRARRRVTLTVGAILLVVFMPVGIRGLFSSAIDQELRGVVLDGFRLDPLIILPGLRQAVMEGLDVAAFWQMRFPAAFDGVVAALDDQAVFYPIYAAGYPEAGPMPGMASFALDVADIRALGLFDFVEGDWETALPILDQGCGVLLIPGAAARHGVSRVGDTWTVDGPDGPVTCTVAGIGRSRLFGSLLGTAALDVFQIDGPMGMVVTPKGGYTTDDIQAELLARIGWQDITVVNVEQYTALVDDILSVFTDLLNALIVVAMLAAALGVVNTMTASVNERERELALLRAVGATGRQIRWLVLGEAALIGLAAALLGTLTGSALPIFQGVILGVSGFGVEGVTPLAWMLPSVGAGLQIGLVAMVAAPLACAGVSWWLARRLERLTVVEALRPESRRRRRVGRSFSRQPGAR